MVLFESDPQTVKWLTTALNRTSYLLEKNHDANHQAINRFLTNTKDVSKVADYFVHYIGKCLFGGDFSKVAKEYHILLSEISTSNPSLEHYLRNLFVNLANREIEYDILTGKNNIQLISKKVVHEINLWFKAAEKGYNENEKMKNKMDFVVNDLYKGHIESFKRGILFLVISVFLSNVAVKIIKTSEVGIKELKSKVDEIYKKQESSYKQFEALHNTKWKKSSGEEGNLVGCILFRGMRITFEEFLNYLHNGFVDRGTSWASEWRISAAFAAGGDVHEELGRLEGHYNIKTTNYNEIVNFFKRCLKEEDFRNNWGEYIAIDVNESKKIIELMRGVKDIISKLPGINLNPLNKTPITIILSYNLFEEKNPMDSLIFLGYHRKIHEGDIVTEHETIFIPKKIKLTNNSVDIFINSEDLQIVWRSFDEGIGKIGLMILDELINKGYSAAEKLFEDAIDDILDSALKNVIKINDAYSGFCKEYLDAAREFAESAKDEKTVEDINALEPDILSFFENLRSREEWIRQNINNIIKGPLNKDKFSKEQTEKIAKSLQYILNSFLESAEVVDELIRKCYKIPELKELNESFDAAIRIIKRMNFWVNWGGDYIRRAGSNELSGYIEIINRMVEPLE